MRSKKPHWERSSIGDTLRYVGGPRECTVFRSKGGWQYVIDKDGNWLRGQKGGGLYSEEVYTSPYECMNAAVDKIKWLVEHEGNQPIVG